MRKNILITAMLLIAFAANAQTPYEKFVEAQFPGTIINTIVRQYSRAKLIGYAETTQGNYFFLTDTNMSQLETIKLPSDYYVTDFEIFKKNSIYLCGYYINAGNSEGLIGYIDITNGFPSVVVTFLATGFIADSTNNNILISRFNELEVYYTHQSYDPGNGNSLPIVSVVAVGEVMDPNSGSTFACAFEAKGPDGDPTIGWTYSCGTSPEESERMTQITETNNYIVTGGHCFGYYDAVKMRVFKKYVVPDMFSNTAYGTNGYNDYYYYTSNNVTNATSYPIDDNWQMTRINNDDIAMTSFWQHGYPPNTTTYDGVLLHVYDINNMLSTPNVPPLYTAMDNTQHYIGTARIADLRYNNNASALNMLITTDMPGFGVQSVTTEIAYPPNCPNPVPYYYVHYPLYNPIVKRDHFDYMNSWQNHISIGSLRGSNDLILYAYPIANTSKCNNSGTMNCDPTDEFTSKMHTYKLGIYRDKVTYHKFQLPTFKITPNIICR